MRNPEGGVRDNLAPLVLLADSVSVEMTDWSVIGVVTS